tara:strand:+ start:1369 stop:1638 length:270 start_codon:yes stop_codon:yes gene_type:complete
MNTIDIDCFGCPNYLLHLSMNILRFNGILMLCATNLRTTTGHNQEAAIRKFRISTRIHPASWEIAKRVQFGSIAKQAWLLGRGIRPLIS